MDYVVGSVAALITGNVTPNRPRLLKKAQTPVKHQQSPNVTPKGELVGDRSIFLSPTLQKKKAIIKKSPKRIFDNPDLDFTKDGEGSISGTSPKADKVKKHLQVDLDTETAENNMGHSKSSKGKQKKSLVTSVSDENVDFPKKGDPSKKNKLILKHSEELKDKSNDVEIKNKKSKITEGQSVNERENVNNKGSPKKKNKNKRKLQVANQDQLNDTLTDNKEETPDNSNAINTGEKTKKKRKKNKKKRAPKQEEIKEISVPNDGETSVVNKIDTVDVNKKKNNNKKKKAQNVVNPNAITQKDTDSEHESDNEFHSDNDNNETINTENQPTSSDDEEEMKDKPKVDKPKMKIVPEDDELKRTLFVGNVPFTKKCKKEIKKIFEKYGKINSVRIRAIPVKDARVTPKLAVIKNELHPDRSTVNVYVKYNDVDSVEKALVENNAVLDNCHLRVSRSSETGSVYDQRKSVFVGNIPFGMEDEAFRTVFQNCGEIHSVRIIRDRKTNVGKGFGYVNFASKDGVELALLLPEEELTIKNRILRVKRCSQLPQSNNKNRVVGEQKSQKNNVQEHGAFRRINNKRKSQDFNKNGPPEKRSRNIDQPAKEKKPRKEFVGLTAEKKKKKKFDKGHNKKKAISEILTK